MHLVLLGVPEYNTLILVAVTSRGLAWYEGKVYDKSCHRFVEIVQRIKVGCSMGDVGIQ